MAVSVRNISKSFSSQIVLDGHSVSFSSGQVHYLTGDNGVGKTVLAKCIAGLLQFESGEIEIGNRKFSGSNYSRKIAIGLGVEYLPQQLPQPLDTSIAEFLMLRQQDLFFQFSRKKHSMASIDEIGSILGLPVTSLFEEDISQLSIVDLQKLYIVRALINSTKILILDEPTAHLDKQSSNRLEKVLEELSNRLALCVIVISHPSQFSLESLQQVRHMTSDIVKNGYVEEEPRSYEPIALHGRAASSSMELKVDGDWKVLEGMALISISGELSPAYTNFFNSFRSSSSENIKLEGFNTIILVPRDGYDSMLSEKLDLTENCIAFSSANRLPVTNWRKSFRRLWSDLYKTNQKTVEEVLDKFDVQPPKPRMQLDMFSGGNRQRFLIGLCCHGVVDLLVIENPFRGLDEKGANLVADQLRRKAESGTKIILLATEGSHREEAIADYNRFCFDGEQLVSPDE